MPVQSTDSFQTSQIGLEFLTDNQTWIVAPHVIVFSGNQDGVSSNGFANAHLINDGFISSAAPSIFAGVAFSPSAGLGPNSVSLLNNTGAEISGAYVGVDFDAKGSNVLNNFGNIIGGLFTGIDFENGAGSALLNNHGYIYGVSFGVLDNAASGGSINNFALIRSNDDGVFIDTSGSTTHVTNAAGATIASAPPFPMSTTPHALVAITPLVLVNNGTMIGEVEADGNASITNHGKIKGMVLLDGPSAFFNGAGGTSGTILAGGNDHIIAGNGAVQIIVGSGNDTLTAGPGADRFIFDSMPAGPVERITNFQHGVDKIVLSEADFANLGPTGILAAGHFHVGNPVTGAAQVIYTPANGFLSYDPDGNGPDARIHFATLINHPALAHTDFVVTA